MKSEKIPAVYLGCGYNLIYNDGEVPYLRNTKTDETREVPGLEKWLKGALKVNYFIMCDDTAYLELFREDGSLHQRRVFVNEDGHVLLSCYDDKVESQYTMNEDGSVLVRFITTFIGEQGNQMQEVYESLITRGICISNCPGKF